MTKKTNKKQNKNKLQKNAHINNKITQTRCGHYEHEKNVSLSILELIDLLSCASNLARIASLEVN